MTRDNFELSTFNFELKFSNTENERAGQVVRLATAKNITVSGHRSTAADHCSSGVEGMLEAEPEGRAGRRARCLARSGKISLREPPPGGSLGNRRIRRGATSWRVGSCPQIRHPCFIRVSSVASPSCMATRNCLRRHRGTNVPRSPFPFRVLPWLFAPRGLRRRGVGGRP